MLETKAEIISRRPFVLKIMYQQIRVDYNPEICE
jgi:hypothetical protein